MIIKEYFSIEFKEMINMLRRDNHYDITVTIDVKAQSIDADVKLTYCANIDNIKEVKMYLNENFEIISIECGSMMKYSFEDTDDKYAFASETKVLTIYLNKPLSKGETIDVYLKYKGIFKINKWEVNMIDEKWVELGLYTPWFPLLKDLKSFTFNANVYIDEEYQLASNGITKKENDYWNISSENESMDIVLIASKKLKSKKIHESGMNFEVFYTDSANQKLVDYTMESSVSLLEYFINLFGETDNKEMKIVFADRSKGGAYVRKGFMSFNLVEENLSVLFKWLAHELAHLWWLKAPTTTWEDWLNESFAEYSSLIAVREKLGEDKFQEYITQKSKIIEGLPPVKGIERTDEDAYSVLYHKGCILLYELECEIGKEKFQNLLYELHNRKIDSTDKFLELLEEISGTSISTLFNEKLCK